MQEAQARIKDENDYNRSHGLTSRKQMMTPARLFPFDKIDEDIEKGVTLVFIAFEVYRKELFPYARCIKAKNPSRLVVIQEDNDSSHLKARRLLAPDIKELERKGSVFAPHPPNSPDLASIETLHKKINLRLQDYRLSVKTASKAKQKEAVKRMKELWQSSSFDKATQRHCSITWYKK